MHDSRIMVRGRLPYRYQCKYTNPSTSAFLCFGSGDALQDAPVAKSRTPKWLIFSKASMALTPEWPWPIVC
jgi:hypothetical protein